MAPAVATAEAGITSCLACCSALGTTALSATALSTTGGPNGARRPVRLAAGDCAGVLVDAVIVGNPGAVAAIGGACHSRVARVRETSEAGRCGRQRCKHGRIEEQAREHGTSSSGWASRNVSTLALQPQPQNGDQ